MDERVLDKLDILIAKLEYISNTLFGLIEDRLIESNECLEDVKDIIISINNNTL